MDHTMSATGRVGTSVPSQSFDFSMWGSFLQPTMDSACMPPMAAAFHLRSQSGKVAHLALEHLCMPTGRDLSPYLSGAEMQRHGGAHSLLGDSASPYHYRNWEMVSCAGLNVLGLPPQSVMIGIASAGTL